MVDTREKNKHMLVFSPVIMFAVKEPKKYWCICCLSDVDYVIKGVK